jgi:hypothetical protein
MDFKKKEKGSCMTKWVIAILVVLLISAIGYIGYGEYKKQELVKMQQVAIASYNQGYVDSVAKIITETNNCQVVPIYVENTTKQIMEISNQCVNLLFQQLTAQQQTAPQGQLQPTQQKK